MLDSIQQQAGKRFRQIFQSTDRNEPLDRSLRQRVGLYIWFAYHDC